MPKRWEYRHITQHGKLEFLGGDDQREKQLNKLGNEGWELIHYCYLEESKEYYMILKREKV